MLNFVNIANVWEDEKTLRQILNALSFGASLNNCGNLLRVKHPPEKDDVQKLPFCVAHFDNYPGLNSLIFVYITTSSRGLIWFEEIGQFCFQKRIYNDHVVSQIR